MTEVAIRCQGENEDRLKCVLLKVSSALNPGQSGDMIHFHLILSVVLFHAAVKAVYCTSQCGIYHWTGTSCL